MQIKRLPGEWKTQGSALITALFIMTLVAIAATALSTHLQFAIYRTQLMMQSDRLYLASQAVAFWGMDHLLHNEKPLTLQKKPAQVATFPATLQNLYPGVVIRGHLDDLQAYFNLNDITDKPFQLVYYNLLELVFPDTDPEQRKNMISTLSQWISPRQLDRGLDTLTDYYLKQKPPYFPGGQPMLSPSELLLVKGMTSKRYQTLLPLVTTLPDKTEINLNTASPKLLRGLGNGLNALQVQEILEARQENGGISKKKIKELLSELNIPSTQITLTSQYFLSVAEVTSGDLSLRVYRVLRRGNNRKGQNTVELIAESINTL